MAAPLDAFFISLSGSGHIESMRAAVEVVFWMGVAGFLYFCFAAVSALLEDNRAFREESPHLVGLALPRARRFVMAALKALLCVLVGGWPGHLVALGLVSPGAMNAFLGPVFSVSV